MSTAASPSVIGREDDLHRIEMFLGRVRDGPAKLLLEGEAGIGKTTLWRAGVERALELGFGVLEARPVAAERELSFAALGDLLAGTHDAIGGLPAPQRRALRVALVLEDAEGDRADQRVVAVAVLGLLRRLSENERLLIAVDDMQWLDTPSAAALQFALRRLTGERVGVLTTSVLGAGTTMVSFDGAERLTVGPLSLQALDQLVRARVGARFLRPTLRQLEEAVGGNPFYALEIAASLLRSGRRLEPGEPLPIPALLLEVVRDRLARLTPTAREAALATAALAQPTVSAVQQAVGGGLAAVSEAVAAGVLDSEGGTLGFTHPLFASTLYEDSPPDEKRHLHRRLADMVGDAEERARHLAEAADGPDEQVASALEAAAANVVARGAPDAGVRLARRAVDLTPPDRRLNSHRRRLNWARYSIAAGDPQHAETLLERQVDVSEPGRERAEVEFELGKARLATLGISAARACYERALRELDGTNELELRTMILIELADMHLGEMRLDSDASERAVALAERLARPDLLARALGFHGLQLTVTGQPPTDEYWRRALEIEEAAGELTIGGPAHSYGHVTFMRGDLETSAELGRRVADSLRRKGNPMLPNHLLGMSEGARVSGDWDAAAGYADEAHDLAVQTGRELLEAQCLMRKARLALPRGDLDLARRQTEEAMALSERLVSSEADRAMVDAMAKAVLGEIAAVSGRHAEGHAWFTASIEAARPFGGFSKSMVRGVLALDIGCLVSLGALDEARRELEQLLRLTDEFPMPRTDDFAARGQGLVAAAEGDFVAAIDHLERAIKSFEDGQWPFELARTLLMLGGVQRRARQKLAARTTLERALEIFERLGARIWAERTRAELNQISGRPARSGALTATEQKVADLVATGHSNAEVAHELFMSSKTVEWNLSKIYKKLHVRSRAELAAKLAKQSAAQQPSSNRESPGRPAKRGG
jgi:DNA-binding CsgD family transcriptional regulator